MSWVLFLLGAYTGASAVLTVACVRVGGRALDAEYAPEPQPVAPVPVVTGCRCLDCATAADVLAVRMLPEATR